MRRPPRGFQLIPEPLLSSGAGGAPIEIGAAPLHLAGGAELCVRDGLPREAGDGLVIEPVYVGLEAKLVMLAAGTWRGRTRINGTPSPCVALLGIGDEVQIDDRLHLHVTMYHRPEIGPARDAHSGGECPVCRARIQSSDVVYVCPRCEAAMHIQPDDDAMPSGSQEDGDEREGLPCARLASECSRCGSRVILDEGYVHVPQFDSGERTL